jgi:hypothetical protein
MSSPNAPPLCSDWVERPLSVTVEGRAVLGIARANWGAVEVTISSPPGLGRTRDARGWSFAMLAHHRPDSRYVLEGRFTARGLEVAERLLADVYLDWLAVGRNRPAVEAACLRAKAELGELARSFGEATRPLVTDILALRKAFRAGELTQQEHQARRKGISRRLDDLARQRGEATLGVEARVAAWMESACGRSVALGEAERLLAVKAERAEGRVMDRPRERWLSAKDPRALLEAYRSARPACGERRWRLFAVTCCRAVDHLMEGAVSQEARQAVEVAALAADGRAGDEELGAARLAVRQARDQVGYCWNDDAYVMALVCGPPDYAEFAAAGSCDASAEAAAFDACHYSLRALRRDPGSAGRLSDLMADLRDLMGDPFGPEFVETWRTPAVLALARTIEQGTFADLPILSDALQDAGCGDEAILGHCRAGRHVRGCWLIDAILGRFHQASGA